MKSIKFIFSTLFVTLLLISCNNKPSLQKYYVANQENQNFIVADFPTSALNITEQSLTKIQLQAYNSVEKLNFLGFKLTADNSSVYETERTKINQILSDDSYKTLIKYGGDKQGAIIKYLGSETSIDEVIIFGSDDSKGFGIVRVLGNNMNPSQIIELVDVVKQSNFDTEQLKGITNFF